MAIYTLHLKTPSGAKNHSSAEAQYRTLSNYPGTNTSLYYPVNAGDVEAFGRKVDGLAAAITQQVRAAYMGEAAIGSANNAKADPAEKKMLEDAALIGHAMQLAYLGKANAYTVFDASVHYDLGRLDNSLKGASVAVNATNVFNKDYISTCDSYYCYYGDERSVVASATYKW